MLYDSGESVTLALYGSNGFSAFPIATYDTPFPNVTLSAPYGSPVIYAFRLTIDNRFRIYQAGCCQKEQVTVASLP